MKWILWFLPMLLGPFTACAKEKRDINKEILVAFKSDQEARNRAKVFARHKVKELQKIGSSPLYLVLAPANEKVEKTIEALKKEPTVKYAEPNMKMRTFSQ